MLLVVTGPFFFAKVWLDPGVALVPWSCGLSVRWFSGPVTPLQTIPPLVARTRFRV